MPFDFKKYDEKCQGMGQDELQREWQHYTRLISGSSTSTTVSALAIFLTSGISIIGVGLSAPAIHNARKKRNIIEKHLNELETTHRTRKRDVIFGVAVSGAISTATLGVGGASTDIVAVAGAEVASWLLLRTKWLLKLSRILASIVPAWASSISARTV